MNRIILSIFALLVVVMPATALAIATGVGESYPVIMRGVRPLGMGNAFVAVPGTDYNAPFYNPAAINDFEKERKYTVGAPMVDFNANFFDAAFDLEDLKHETKKGISVSTKLDLFNNYTKKYMGQFNSMVTSMPLFQVRHKYYHLTAVGDYRLTLSFRNVAFPNFDYKTEATTGIVGGTACSIIEDHLQLGINAKALFRMTREDEVTGADIIVNSIDKLIGFETWRKGFGVGFDVGGKLKVPLMEDELAPAIGVSIQDIGDTRFTGGAADMPMSVSAGIGIFPKIKKVALSIAADIREINRETDFINRFHFGMEAVLPEIKKIKTRFTLRAGCNQGYIATGFTAKWPLVSYTFAFYGEEVGKYSHSKPSYRMSNLVAFEF